MVGIRRLWNDGLYMVRGRGRDATDVRLVLRLRLRRVVGGLFFLCRDACVSYSSGRTYGKICALLPVTACHGADEASL